MNDTDLDCSLTQTENVKPFCASSPEAQLLSDADFWAAVFPQPEDRDEPDMDDWPELVIGQCLRCGAGIRVEDYEEAVERQDQEFCDDCASENGHYPDCECWGCRI